MTTPKPEDQYSEQETRQRFDAALRGARKVGHKPMKGGAKATKQARKRRHPKSTRSD